MNYILIIIFVFSFSGLFSQTKYELWQQHSGQTDIEFEENDLGKFEDRKRSVFDKGNMVLRLSNAATYGYSRWGLSHEFPAGSVLKNGCCTYYWTQSPIVGALINGQPSVANGVRGSYRDSEEEFEPLPGYDAGYVDTEANIGIAFSDKPESWPSQWPAEVDDSRTFYSDIYDFEGNLDTTIAFPGIEPEVVDGFPDAPCGYGIQADREGYFVVTDNDPSEGNTFASNGGTGPLNVRVDTWVLNYSLTYGNDGLIFIEKMTNVGKDTLKSLYFGITGDPDSPSEGSSEWTDDLALFIEQDDPLIDEKLIDTTDAHLLGNMAIVYDSDDNSSGFIESNVAWVGVKFLGCTHVANDETLTDYDVSAFTTYAYTDDATSDADAYYNQLAGGIEEPDNITPHESDIFNKPYSYGPDITWVIAAGPIDVAPGETVYFTFADFMGVNESDLLRNARLFQQLYDNDCKTPLPPAPPIVQAVPGDGKVYLYWDGQESEVSVDPVTGNIAFEGYRIYRSSDNGITWGSVINNFDGSPTEVYKPLAIFDLDNEYSGAYAMDDPLLYYDMGSNSGLKYSYVDESLINGYEYYYSVSAYDHQDSWSGAPVDPLENPKQKDAINTVKVVPEPKPSGYNREITPNHISGFSNAELTVVESDPFNNDPMDLQVLNDFDGSTLFEINAYTSCGEMYSDTNGNGNYDIGEPYEDLNPNGSWDDKVFNPLTNKNFWGVDYISLDSMGIETSIPIVDFDYNISSGQAKYIIDNMVPVIQNGSWDIDTSSAIEMISNANSNGVINISEIGFEGKKTFSELFGCESDVHIMDCAGNCFNYNIMDFIYNDGYCEDGSFGIDLRCEEFLYDFGDCCEVIDGNGCDELNLESFCLDYYDYTDKPSLIDLRRDLEFRFSNQASLVPAFFMNGDNSGEFGYINTPFEVWTSDDDIFQDELDRTSLPFILLLNLEGNDTLDFSSALFQQNPDGNFIFNRDFHIVPGYNFNGNFNSENILTIDEFSDIREIIPFNQFKNLGWIIGIDQQSNWNEGDVLKISFDNPFIPGEDIYTFSSDPPDYQVESDIDLNNVRVVPNPFKITSVFQNNIEVKELQFHNLPDIAVIRIYNTAGELVKLIKHEEGSDGYRGTSIEAWNLRTYNEQEIAFGVYLFHVKADGFEKTGKFAVIK